MRQGRVISKSKVVNQVTKIPNIILKIILKDIFLIKDTAEQFFLYMPIYIFCSNVYSIIYNSSLLKWQTDTCNESSCLTLRWYLWCIHCIFWNWQVGMIRTHCVCHAVWTFILGKLKHLLFFATMSDSWLIFFSFSPWKRKWNCGRCSRCSRYRLAQIWKE